eukprot:1140560-Pelagomonas_calceolata.AAC.1
MYGGSIRFKACFGVYRSCWSRRPALPTSICTRLDPKEPLPNTFNIILQAMSRYSACYTEHTLNMLIFPVLTIYASGAGSPTCHDASSKLHTHPIKYAHKIVTARHAIESKKCFSKSSSGAGCL